MCVHTDSQSTDHPSSRNILNQVIRDSSATQRKGRGGDFKQRLHACLGFRQEEAAAASSGLYCSAGKMYGSE
eukprot:560410-Pelagomonas_calceolata.AAC.5